MLVQSVDTAILADAETAYEIRRDFKKGLSLDAYASVGWAAAPLPARPGYVKSED